MRPLVIIMVILGLALLLSVPSCSLLSTAGNQSTLIVQSPVKVYTTRDGPIPLLVGKECINCHSSVVTHVATGSHSGLSCDTCHRDVDSHVADPLEEAEYPEPYFDKKRCNECHDDRYSKWVEYIMEEVEVPVVKEVTVVKEVQVVKEVSVVKEVPVQLSDWGSPEALKQFLAGDDTDKHVFLTVNAAGTIEFQNQCEDFALQLRDRAMKIGKYLSIITLPPTEYLKWYGKSMPPDMYHAICMARIGNEFWYIEPTNDKCWLALYLD